MNLELVMNMELSSEKMLLVPSNTINTMEAYETLWTQPTMDDVSVGVNENRCCAKTVNSSRRMVFTMSGGSTEPRPVRVCTEAVKSNIATDISHVGSMWCDISNIVVAHVAPIEALSRSAMGINLAGSIFSMDI